MLDIQKSCYHLRSPMVPAPQVSVSPYPWVTLTQKQHCMKRCALCDSAAPPVRTNLISPPSNLRSLEKTNLWNHKFNRVNPSNMWTFNIMCFGFEYSKQSTLLLSYHSISSSVVLNDRQTMPGCNMISCGECLSIHTDNSEHSCATIHKPCRKMEQRVGGLTNGLKYQVQIIQWSSFQNRMYTMFRMPKYKMTNKHKQIILKMSFTCWR